MRRNVFDTRATSVLFSFILILFHVIEVLFLSAFLTFPYKFVSFFSSSFIIIWFYLYFNLPSYFMTLKFIVLCSCSCHLPKNISYLLVLAFLFRDPVDYFASSWTPILVLSSHRDGYFFSRRCNSLCWGWTQPFSPKCLYLSKKIHDVMLLHCSYHRSVDFIP